MFADRLFGIARNDLRGKTALLVVDACAAVAFALVLAAATPGVAYAYIDPSVMTYAIQSIASVAVAVGAVIGVAWRRVRARILYALEIDGNARKLVDGEIHAVPAGSAPKEPSIEKAKRVKKKVRTLPWGWRFVYALLACLFAVSTYFVFTPLDMVVSNASELIFTVEDVWFIFVIPAAAIIVFATFIISAFPGRAFAFLLGLVTALGICAYVQMAFLNGSLPAADGKAVDWGNYADITAISTAVWVGIILLFFVISLKKTILTRYLSFFFSVFLIAAQAVNLANIIPPPTAPTEEGNPSYTVTEKGMFSVSSKSNVIVFILDHFDETDLSRIIEERPELLDWFPGFTYYPNASGSFETTRYALPFLLTGDWHTEDVDGDIWNEGARFIDAIYDQGYSVGVYSTKTYRGKDVFAEKTINISDGIERTIDYPGTLEILLQSSLYSEMPWVFKPEFRYYTEDLNKKTVDSSNMDDPDNTPYNIDDALFYQKLMASAIRADDESEAGSFRFIHLMGDHPPYTLGEDASYSPDATADTQAVGALAIAAQYASDLRRAGVYDQTTFIITADHGVQDTGEEVPTRTINPILLVKPAQSRELDVESCKISEVPTGHLDFHATVIDAIGGDTSAWQGIPIYNVGEEDRYRWFMKTVNSSHSLDAKDDVEWVEYAIEGDARDIDNWYATGRSWKNILPD